MPPPSLILLLLALPGVMDPAQSRDLGQGDMWEKALIVTGLVGDTTAVSS